MTAFNKTHQLRLNTEGINVWAAAGWRRLNTRMIDKVITSAGIGAFMFGINSSTSLEIAASIRPVQVWLCPSADVAPPDSPQGKYGCVAAACQRGPPISHGTKLISLKSWKGNTLMALAS